MLRGMAHILRLMLFLGFILSCPRPLFAQTWNGSVSDLWSNASNWTPNTVPNSSSANVTITNATNNPVIIDISPTIGNLMLGVSNSLDISSQSLYVAGPSIGNSGQFNIGPTGAATIYVDSSSVTLSGGGTVSLQNANSYLQGYSGPTANTLVNQSTINGQGYIYNVTLNNQVTIDANVSGGTLWIYGNPTTNTGTLQATGGGTLDIYASTVTNTGGTISTDSSSSAILNDSTINGGNLTSSGSAMIHGVNNAILNGVTLTTGSTYSVDAGNTNFLTGNLTNNGTVLIGGSAGGSTLYADATTVTLSGSGVVTLNNANSYLQGYSGPSGDSLVNQSTINGQGYIYNVTLNNQGTIDANVSGGTLWIYGNPTTNTGTLQATGGGTLDIYASTVTNTGGTISTDSSSSVILNDSTINGGNLTSSGSAMIHGINNATLNGVTLTTGSTYSVDAGNTNFLTGNLTNNGTVLIGGSAGGSTLYLDASTVSLSGSGTVTLNNANSYLQGYSGPTGNTLVNQSTINGQGYIYNVTLNNPGTINANVSGGTLWVYGNPTTNTGTLQATGGGTLDIYASTVTNTGGTISTDSSSSVILNDSTINGGNLTSSGSAMIHGVNNATLNGVTLTTGSTYSVDAGNTNFLTGNLTNNGTVLIGGSAGGSTLYLDASTVSLSGSGTVTLNNANSYLQGYSGPTGNTLVNQSTINGQGYIYNVTLNNQGTINANVSGGTLYIYASPSTNSGILRADAGATLNLNASTLTNFASTGATAGTLTGGTYEVFSGTLSFNNGGFTNDIVTNAATIVLDGTAGAPKLLDQNGNNALANFATNAAAGTFTIQNGVSVTSSSAGFSNAGLVNIGASSTFTVGGAERLRSDRRHHHAGDIQQRPRRPIRPFRCPRRRNAPGLRHDPGQPVE